jgi:hypothetical protein
MDPGVNQEQVEITLTEDLEGDIEIAVLCVARAYCRPFMASEARAIRGSLASHSKFQTPPWCEPLPDLSRSSVQAEREALMKRWQFGLTLAVAAMALAACTPGVNPQIDVSSPEGYIAGFGLGLWHGFIIPVTFFLSLFGDSVNIYEVHNTGNLYDIGYVLGVAALVTLVGGSSWGVSRRRRKAE